MKTITNNPIVSFSLVLLACITVVAALHFVTLEKLGFPLYENKIILAYIVNTIQAIIIYTVLYFLRIKQEHNLGFIYMIGSLLKFGAFFLLFNSSYKADGEINSLEFSAFFIPYGVCLFLETYYLIKLLNKK